METILKIEIPLLLLSECTFWPIETPSFIPVTYSWITVRVFPWYLICSAGSLSDFWSPLRSDSVDHISHAPHRPNVLTAFFLMRGRTQSECSVKSTICLSSPISCAVHSHTVLLTQNKDGMVSLFEKTRRAARSDSSWDTFKYKVYSHGNVTFVICHYNFSHFSSWPKKLESLNVLGCFTAGVNNGNCQLSWNFIEFIIWFADKGPTSQHCHKFLSSISLKSCILNSACYASVHARQMWIVMHCLVT